MFAYPGVIYTSDWMQVAGPPPFHLLSQRLHGLLDTQHGTGWDEGGVKIRGSLEEHANRPLTAIRLHKAQ